MWMLFGGGFNNFISHALSMWVVFFCRMCELFEYRSQRKSTTVSVILSYTIIPQPILLHFFSKIQNPPPLFTVYKRRFFLKLPFPSSPIFPQHCLSRAKWILSARRSPISPPHDSLTPLESSTDPTTSTKRLMTSTDSTRNSYLPCLWSVVIPLPLRSV